MNSKRIILIVLALVFLFPLLTSCNNGQVTTSSCSYAAEITAGNSTKKIPTGNCAGSFLSTGAAIHIRVGESVTVHFIDSAGSKGTGMASARSENPKVLELTAGKSMEQRYQGLAPGVSEILFSPPINIPQFCLSGYGGTIATPCVVAKVTVAQSCVGKLPGKCNSSLGKGATGSNEATPQISPSLAALKAKRSPLAVLCKPGFFTKAQAQQIVQQFGFIECFRFTGKDQWVVIGSGVRQNSNAPPPNPTGGGPIVAIEKCASSDSTCLNPSTIHRFSDFTVYYPPDPSGDFLGNLYATAYGDLLSINGVNYCPATVFDITNGKWYPESASEKVLEANPGSVKSLPTPAPVSGAKALTQEAPPATTSAC